MTLHEKENSRINFRRVKLLAAALAAVSLASLQMLSMPNSLKIDSTDSLDNTNNNIAHAAASVDQVGGRPVAIKLNYAHFVPLTNSSQSHQVKVIVVYSLTPSLIAKDRVQNAVMKVYAINGSLLKTTSFPDGLKLNSTGRVQLATTLSESTIRNVTASVLFTDSSKSANYSNILDVKLGLGQIIQP
ncbi:MAG TPA: hypothetical protein VH796_15600 [Nitrososphaeraceae archaeon]